MHFSGTICKGFGLKTCQFGVDGVIVKSSGKHAPFVVGVHCNIHRCNLPMWTLSNLLLVRKIETFL
jgi:hypothetical protein